MTSVGRPWTVEHCEPYFTAFCEGPLVLPQRHPLPSHLNCCSGARQPGPAAAAHARPFMTTARACQQLSAAVSLMARAKSGAGSTLSTCEPSCSISELIHPLFAPRSSDRQVRLKQCAKKLAIACVTCRSGSLLFRVVSWQQNQRALYEYKSHVPGANSVTRWKASNGQRARTS